MTMVHVIVHFIIDFYFIMKKACFNGGKRLLRISNRIYSISKFEHDKLCLNKESVCILVKKNGIGILSF
ncbi:hypothetical protein MtrunA17_Chr1g0200351 [Medicago truncatula]|uniref:Uncharacterized protein n=1 Tax=Medicago truncatula TaxID=3880 RepID=A0A396JTA4_MEDTR|nr:hypothetical protein MtrunA17_Chr1g0200351 [Medicago truncatula]